MRTKQITTLLSVLLISQVILFYSIKTQQNSDHLADGSEITVTRSPSHNFFLESELIKEGFAPERFEEFRVTNRSQAPILVSVESPSCGCSTFIFDGQAHKINKHKLIIAGGHLDIGSKIRLPSSPQTRNQSFNVVARNPSNPNEVIFKKKILTTFGVYRDFSTNVRELKFVSNSKTQLPNANESSATMYVATSERDPTKALVIEASELLKNQITIKIVPKKIAQELSSQLFQHEYEVFFKLHKDLEIIKNQSVEKECCLYILLPSNSLPAEYRQSHRLKIPVTIRDASQLDVVNSISFGVVSQDEKRSRSILISTLDNEPLTFSCKNQSGPGTLNFKKNTEHASEKTILTISFLGDKPGDYQGTFLIVPEGGRYQTTKIDYNAKVIQE